MSRYRNKLFFFWSQEFQKQQVVSGAARAVHIPTELERMGDFSHTFDTGDRLIPVYNPEANQTVSPGNRIPANRFHAVGQKVLGLFPMPNFIDPAVSRRNQSNYIANLRGDFHRHSEVVRGDVARKKNMQTYLRLNNSFEH